MRDSKSSDRRWLLLILLLLGVVFVSADRAPLDSPTRRLEVQKSQAQLGCGALASAAEKYTDHEANKKHEFPNTLRDLVQPPFGAPPFLGDGETDLIDPWGKPYEMERKQRPDGTDYILVKTTAPDGTPITQFGIGPTNSIPKW